MTCWDYLICNNKLEEGVQMDSSANPERYQIDHSEVGGYYADMNVVKVDENWRIWLSCVDPLPPRRPAHDFVQVPYTGSFCVLDNMYHSGEPGVFVFDCVDGVVVKAESIDYKERNES